MDIKWGDPRSAKFASSVGLITSKGSKGDNIMSAEWTHQISYEPAIFLICIGKEEKQTALNIKKNKEFGLHLAADNQNILASISGNYSGKDVDKIKVLKDLGFKFEKASKIDVLMVKDVSFSVECKLKKVLDIGGDHELFFGEVVKANRLSEKETLVYYKRKFWKTGEQLHRPDEEYINKINGLLEKYKR